MILCPPNRLDPSTKQRSSDAVDFASDVGYLFRREKSLLHNEITHTFFQFDFVELIYHELVDPTIVSGSTLVYVANPMYFLEAFAFLNTNDK